MANGKSLRRSHSVRSTVFITSPPNTPSSPTSLLGRIILQVTDLPFLHPPSRLALAALLREGE